MCMTFTFLLYFGFNFAAFYTNSFILQATLDDIMGQHFSGYNPPIHNL